MPPAVLQPEARHRPAGRGGRARGGGDDGARDSDDEGMLASAATLALVSGAVKASGGRKWDWAVAGVLATFVYLYAVCVTCVVGIGVGRGAGRGVRARGAAGARRAWVALAGCRA